MPRRKPAAARTGPSWNIPVAVAGIPETGRKLEVAADAATRASLAKTIGVVALPRLEVSVELFRHGHDGVRAAGQVAATVEQSCVVSLEPLHSEVVEAFDLLFVPALSENEAATDAALDPGGDEPPETLHAGTVDIGAVAVEFLLLGIDPYPRKPGVQFDAPPAGDPAAHPFAALAALKKPS